MMHSEQFSHSLILNSKTERNFFRLFDITHEITIEQAVENVLIRYSDNINMMNEHYPQELFKNRYRIGETVTVSYSPDSQRYIEYYEEQTFTGTIFFVDNEQDNMFLFNKSPETGLISTHSLEREGCHYLGIARGYTYFIDKYIDENK